MRFLTTNFNKYSNIFKRVNLILDTVKLIPEKEAYLI